MRRVLEEALECGLPDMALYNCHTPGVDSIVLNYSPYEPIKMTRMFVAWPSQKLWQLLQPDGSYTVAVHNHRYDIRLTCLTGQIINYEIYVKPLGIQSFAPRPIFEHTFQSGINGELHISDNPRLMTIAQEHYQALSSGQDVLMRAEQLHTVIVPPRHRPVAWLVHEGQDRIDPLLYSAVPNPSIETDGLYEKMSTEDARSIVLHILQEMK